MRFSKRQIYPIQTLIENKDVVDWKWISSKYEFSTQDLKKAQDYLYWDDICYRRKFTLEEMRMFADKINWSWLCYSNVMARGSFIREFKDYIDFGYFKYLALSTDIRRQFKEQFGLPYNVSRLAKRELSEFISRKEWDDVSRNIWSEEAIKYCKDYVNWYIISGRRRYTIQFYWDMREYLDWDVITKEYAPKWKLYAFKKFQKYLNWEEIKTWSWINKDVKKTFKKRLGIKEEDLDKNTFHNY